MRRYTSLVVIGVLLVLAAVVDWLLLPLHNLTLLFTFPIFFAALHLLPRQVIAVIGVDTLVAILVTAGEHVPALAILLSIAEVSLVGLLAIALAKERVEAQRHAERARTEERRWQEMIERISNGFLAFDRNGGITYANQQAAHFLNRSPIELRGSNIWTLLPATFADLKEHCQQALRSGEPVAFAVYEPAKNVWLEVHAYPSRTGLSLFLEDVTTRKRAEAERIEAVTKAEAARAEAEQAQERLQRFLAMVAHDLRGPITLILGYTQLLYRHLGSLSCEKEERALRTTINAGETMRRLVDDLLDAARIGAGQLELTPAPMDLVKLLRQVAEEEQSTTSTHHLVLDLPPQLEGVWDYQRIGEVFTNLVSNAIKYSPHGGEIRISAHTTDQRVIACVEDHGIGISKEHLAHLFEPFYRIPLPAEISQKGIGLGLYITKAIVEAHHGRIDVKTEPGRGSTFCVELPRLPASAIMKPRSTKSA